MSPNPIAPTHSQEQQHLTVRYVGSRFNSITRKADGGLVVINSLTGYMNSVGPAQADVVAKILVEGVPDLTHPVAKYLFDRRMLVRDRIHEYEVFASHAQRQHHRTDVLELILLSSEECDFRCTYCYETFPRAVMPPAIRSRVKKLLDRRVPDLRSLSIAWFGGEPLHGFEAIADIAPYAKALAIAHGVSFDSRITTNGYLLTLDRATQLLDWQVRRFQISLDGPAPVHDSRRMLLDGGPTFDVIFRNLVALQSLKANYTVVLRINFDKDTVSSLDHLLKQLGGQFANDARFFVRFSPVGRWGGPNDDSLDVYGTRSGKLERLRLIQQAQDVGLQVDGTLLDTCGGGSNVCYAARPYNFVVGANGSLMKCTIVLDQEDYNVVGRLSDDGEPVLNHSKLAAWTELAYEKDETCQTCSLLASCQGMSCPLERIDEGHRPCSSTPKPALAEEMISVGDLRGTRRGTGR